MTTHHEPPLPTTVVHPCNVCGATGNETCHVDLNVEDAYWMGSEHGWSKGQKHASAAGHRAELDAVVKELERMLGVCDYPEVRAFLPLLIDRLKDGGHHA